MTEHTKTNDAADGERRQSDRRVSQDSGYAGPERRKADRRTAQPR